MIRAGCIGTGGISKVHLQYLKSRKDVKITALCDINKKNLKQRHQEFGGKVFTDFNKMIESENLDAVWLCTPPQVRREPLLACANRGIPVFCEKPVERSLLRAGKIAAELRKRKGRVQIGYVFRSMPIIQHLRQEITDDRIHLVQSFYGCNISLTRAFPSWFYDKALSGGALIDQATHNLDLFRLLIGNVKKVRGFASNPVHTKEKRYTVDEVIALSLLFENGTMASHVHTWVGDMWRNEMLMVGQKRVYRLDFWRGVLTVEEGDKTRSFRQNQKRMYEHQNARFLQMVASGDWSRNPCDYDDGLATLKLTLACDKAISSGRSAGVRI